jgi:hypothetical protein
MKELKNTDLFKMAPDDCCGCGPGTSESVGAETCAAGSDAAPVTKKILNIDLLVVDLSTCKRCVPTGDQLRAAVRLLAPVAEALGIELRHHEIVVQTPQEAKNRALLSSPTIRVNGRDIAQDIRESLCESCGDLTNNNTKVDCREWHYRGRVYFAAPLPMLIESIMGAMMNIDAPPAIPEPLEELPENLQRYFSDKKQTAGCC